MSTAVAEIHEEEVVDKELEGFTEEKFDYDDEFQSKIAALTLRDDEFLRRAAHILKPEFSKIRVKHVWSILRSNTSINMDVLLILLLLSKLSRIKLLLKFISEKL